MDCPVCFGKKGDKKLNCGHEICYNCFNILRKVQPKCPLCRKLFNLEVQVDKVEYIPFLRRILRHRQNNRRVNRRDSINTNRYNNRDLIDLITDLRAL